MRVRRTLGLLILFLVALNGSADQRAAALPGLLGELSAAEDPVTADAIERQIWDLWLTGPTEDASRTLANVRARLSVGEADRAEAALDTLVNAYPEFAEAWNQRAILRYMRGDYRGSLADIDRTLALEPRHFGALSGRGQCLLQVRDAPGALKAFEAAVAIHPWLLDVQRQIEVLRAALNHAGHGV